MITDEQRRLVTGLLREEPFKCSRVFFFHLEDRRPVPLDEESQMLYKKERELVEALPYGQTLENWAGNMVEGPREEAWASFYASYRFDHVMVVVSKVVEIPNHRTQVETPFNKFFVDAIAASIAPVLGGSTAMGTMGTTNGAVEAKRTTPFNELAAWRECKPLWRKTFGAEVWIAIKGTQAIATAKTQEELDEKLRELKVEPPLLYAPPESEEKVYDIISNSRKNPSFPKDG